MRKNSKKILIFIGPMMVKGTFKKISTSTMLKIVPKKSMFMQFIVHEVDGSSRKILKSPRLWSSSGLKNNFVGNPKILKKLTLMGQC